MKKLKVGVIGVGRLGYEHACNIANRVPGMELVAICDGNTARATEVANELGVKKTYSDPATMCADPEVEAVAIFTNTASHVDMIRIAMEAGKHVFCEKPMALDEKECDEMIEACRVAGVKLQLGFMRRFDKSFRRTKELIDSGAIGDVAMIKSNTYGPSEPREWMYDVRKSYGPVGEVNSHDFDTVRWYAGSEVKLIHAIGHNFRSPEKSEEYPEYYDTCSVLLQFENGVIATITGAQYVRYGYDSRAEVLGTKGIVKVGSQETNSVELVTADQTIQRDSMDSWRTLFRDAYLAEAQAFVNCVLNDTEPEVTGYDGKMALILVNEGLRSILEKRPIEITR